MGYPNQKRIVIHRDPSRKTNFIQISKDIFSKAYQRMSRAPGALALYLWLVGNKDKYTFEFSPQAILNQLGMPLSTTHEAIKRLKEQGYLVEKDGSSTLDFYEVPLDDKGSTAETKTDVVSESKLEKAEDDTRATPLSIRYGDFRF